MSKPILAIALDGVVARDVCRDSSGDFSMKAVPGARAFLGRAAILFDIVIVTPLARTEEGLRAVYLFLNKTLGTHVEEVRVSSQMPSASVLLDARAVVFSGSFPEPAELLEHCPWHERRSSGR